MYNKYVKSENSRSQKYWEYSTFELQSTLFNVAQITFYSNVLIVQPFVIPKYVPIGKSIAKIIYPQ